MKNLKDIVDRSIKNIRTSLTGVITSVLKSNNSVYVKLSTEEEIRDVKIISPYGFYSIPNNGLNGQLIFNGNSSKRASLIGVEHDKLPVNLEIGDALIYSNNSFILLKDDAILFDGKIENDELNLKNDIAGTSQKIIFSNNKIEKLQHKKGDIIIREDVFSYQQDRIIETRTMLSSGKKLTFIFHKDTLETEII